MNILPDHTLLSVDIFKPLILGIQDNVINISSDERTIVHTPK